MNVSELYALTYWIDEEIRQTEVVNRYQQLQSVIQRHTQPNQQKASFEQEKENLFSVLKDVALEKLSKDQITFLEHLGIAEAVGSEGISSVEDLLFRNVIDVANTAQKLANRIQKINEGLTKSHKIQEGLEGCVSYEEYEESDEVLMRVSFTKRAAISNISDLKTWGGIWYEIGRGIAMAHDSSPEDVRVIGATKGSIIIELAVAASVAGTASTIILSALKVADKVLDIRKKAEEIRGMKLKNDKLALDLEKEAENEKESGIKDISKVVIKKCSLNAKQEGDKITALENSVKKLVSFIEDGGEVDFVIPEDEESEEGEISRNEDLRLAFQEIRQLESKLNLLTENSAQQSE